VKECFLHSTSLIFIDVNVGHQTGSLSLAAKCVGKFDLARRLTLHLEQIGAGDNYSHASSTRDCNIQAIQTVQEFHAPCPLLPRGKSRCYAFLQSRGWAGGQPLLRIR
jgi:hypothetical protein